jgi:hypothetical protein
VVRGEGQAEEETVLYAGGKNPQIELEKAVEFCTMGVSVVAAYKPGYVFPSFLSAMKKLSLFLLALVAPSFAFGGFIDAAIDDGKKAAAQKAALIKMVKAANDYYDLLGEDDFSYYKFDIGDDLEKDADGKLSTAANETLPGGLTDLFSFTFDGENSGTWDSSPVKVVAFLLKKGRDPVKGFSSDVEGGESSGTWTVSKDTFSHISFLVVKSPSPVIPEPGTLIFGLTGLALTGPLLRRRRR